MTANAASTDLLRRLLSTESIKIKQKKELLEIILDFETNNRYEIYDLMNNEMIYFAGEQTGCCMRYWCGANRSFKIHISDKHVGDIMRISRPLKCHLGPCCACLDCCIDEATVECPPGNVIGFVRQSSKNDCCTLSVDILDANGNKIVELKRNGPCGHCMCTMFLCWHQDIVIPLVASNGTTEIGKLSRVYQNCCKELYTDADNFEIHYPKDLQVEVKALVLAATFLIDFMYFERSKDHDNDS